MANYMSPGDVMALRRLPLTKAKFSKWQRFTARLRKIQAFLLKMGKAGWRPWQKIMGCFSKTLFDRIFRWTYGCSVADCIYQHMLKQNHSQTILTCWNQSNFNLIFPNLSWHLYDMVLPLWHILLLSLGRRAWELQLVSPHAATTEALRL